MGIAMIGRSPPLGYDLARDFGRLLGRPAVQDRVVGEPEPSSEVAKSFVNSRNRGIWNRGISNRGIAKSGITKPRDLNSS